MALPTLTPAAGPEAVPNKFDGPPDAGAGGGGSSFRIRLSDIPVQVQVQVLVHVVCLRALCLCASKSPSLTSRSASSTRSLVEEDGAGAHERRRQLESSSSCCCWPESELFRTNGVFNSVGRSVRLDSPSRASVPGRGTLTMSRAAGAKRNANETGGEEMRRGERALALGETSRPFDILSFHS